MEYRNVIVTNLFRNYLGIDKSPCACYNWVRTI